MKRNFIDEITAKKSRTNLLLGSRHSYSSRLSCIERSFQKNLEDNRSREFLKYFPIVTVACFEAFFRSVYKELIDFGKPFSDNVVKFNEAKNIKFDFNIFNAIQTKTVTAGEFISHILRCNNFKDIDENLSILCGINFTEQIKKSIDIDNADQIFPNINLADQIIVDIKRTFELRHIFCHEFATNLSIDKDEILMCFNSAKIFLEETNEFVSDLMYPNAPKNYADMNTQASEEFTESENNLSVLISTIKKEAKNENLISDLNIKLFDETIEKWKIYRESKAKLYTSDAEGETSYPAYYYSSLTTITEEKIEELKETLQLIKESSLENLPR